MENAKLRTQDDFNGPPSPKRKYSRKACECCRKLKIRCLGGEAVTLGNASLAPKPCNHCVSQSRTCVWPPEDGRKRARTSSSGNAIARPTKAELRQQDCLPEPTLPSASPTYQRNGAESCASAPNHGVLFGSNTPASIEGNNGKRSAGEGSDSSASQTPYTTVHYHRHLGPTAIAPGHKKIALKARQDYDRHSVSPVNCASSHSHIGLLPLFDAATDLPVKELLPHLLESFYEYYADTYCFLMNRKHLESLIEQGKASAFLVCVMSALSSRFCSSEIFTDYLPPNVDGSARELWQLSVPFLERAKALTMPALNLPSAEVVGGLLMLAWADFGDNNEAGMNFHAFQHLLVV